MSRISRVVFNNRNWNQPSNSDKQGIYVSRQNLNSYYFGLEEWNFTDRLKDLRLGYLDCFRKKLINGVINKIFMVTLDINDNCYYHIATLYKVEQIKKESIRDIKNTLGTDWLSTVNRHFTNGPFNDDRDIENHNYYNNWMSENIVDHAPNGFILNIRYESIKILDKRINLTQMDSEINDRRIHRISNIYQTSTIINGDYNQNLKDYLKYL